MTLPTERFRSRVTAIDGNIGLTKLTSVLNARDVTAGRIHGADVRFTKELGNRKRNKLAQMGDKLMRHEAKTLVIAAKAAQGAYGLKSDVVTLVAACLLRKYGVTYVGDRGKAWLSMGSIDAICRSATSPTC